MIPEGVVGTWNRSDSRFVPFEWTKGGGLGQNFGLMVIRCVVPVSAFGG